MKVTLRNEVRFYRSQEKLTQEKLAEMAGTTRKSVNAIEANRMVPSIILSIQIAKALKVPLEDLFILEAADD